MEELCAGFARVNITPLMGIPLAGYYETRISDGVLDELEANALALSLGETKLLAISVDHLGIEQRWLDPIRRYVADSAGIPLEGVFIACTHTHTAPLIRQEAADGAQRGYLRFLQGRLADAARFALADLRPARMGWAVGRAPGIAFERRFRMKDGSIITNPGVENPDIVGPVGQPDERVSVLRFDREDAPGIVLVHFGVHPDTVGGCKVSADWPGFARRFVERAIEGVRCILFNGAQGDVNHVNVAPKEGELNGLTMDFDDVMRGYGHARHMGRTVAGAVMQVFDKACYTPVHSLRALQRTVQAASNMPRPEELPLARRYDKLHREHRDGEIPYEGMLLTTVVAEAERILRLEHGPEAFPLHLSVLAIGEVALFGIPGEPFAAVGQAIGAGAKDWQLVLSCCCANGYEGYFPMMDAFEEGGYEARSSIFQAGVAETIVREGLGMLAAVRYGSEGGKAYVE